ncbi:ribonuclease PH [candidate division TA06 bacterium]|nr:ribonuclease PH [candidate division TA06 bacterium]
MRSNGRKSDELRSVKITRNYLKDVEGSCLIEAGETHVICSATIQETVPSFLKGGGEGWITAEYGMLPRSSKVRIERRRVSGRSQEIQRLIGRSLRAACDFSLLGERTILLDCDVIQADGGTRTLSVTGAFVALYDAIEKMLHWRIISRSPVLHFVAGVSCGIVDGQLLLDLCYKEDFKALADLNIVMTDNQQLVEIQGTAEGRPFDEGELTQMIGLAKKGISELIQIQKAALGIEY